MSLKLWLPLNNTMKNYGLTEDIIQTDSPTYTNGKVGKALSTGGCKMSASQTASILNNNALSICFWVYINADSTDNIQNRTMFFGNDSIGKLNNRKFSLFNYPTINDLHWYWQNDAADNFFAGDTLRGVLPSYKWTHVAVTYQNPNGTIYINGEKITTFTGISNSSSFAYETQIIHSSNYLIRSDFRIYDHCLSIKEIHHIYQQLVLHYKLSNQYEIGNLNKYSGEEANGSLLSSTVFKKTKLINERGYNYKLDYTGTGENTWPNLRLPNYKFIVGKRYFYSCKVRCYSKNFNIYLRAARSNNDWVTNSINVLNPDGKWHEYVVSQIIPESYDRSGSIVASNPVLEMYSDNLNKKDFLYSVNFDIKDLQVIESDSYVPFIENSHVNTIITDCSGYKNHGIKAGEIKWNDDTMRNTGSYLFNGKSSIKCNTDQWHSGSINNTTISFWIKSNTSTAGGAGGIMCESPAAPIMSMYGGVWQFTNGSNWVNYNNGGVTVGVWSHHACTLKDNVISIYKNGNLIGTHTDKTILTELSSSNFVAVGCDFPGGDEYFNGLISDFRIYTTALSDREIKALYNTPISVSKNGGIYAYEFMEVE